MTFFSQTITTKIKRYSLFLAALLVLGGGIFLVQGVFPDSFWRLEESDQKLAFRFGSENNADAKVYFMANGQVGIGGEPIGESVLLELRDAQKGFALPRVPTLGTIQNPHEGMMVYDEGSNCFKFYQRSKLPSQRRSWSPCLGMGDHFVVTSVPPLGAKLGDLYYDPVQKSLHGYTPSGWLSLATKGLNLGDSLPSGSAAKTGSLFFNTQNSSLQIFDGSEWKEALVNFASKHSSQIGCQNHDLLAGEKEFSCGNHSFLTGLRLEASVWENQEDRHSIPEVNGFECCQVAFGHYWWDTSPWGACQNDTETRGVSCKDYLGALVSTDHCVVAHKPNLSRSCR